MRKVLLGIVLWTWRLPESFLGFLYYIYFRNKIIKRRIYRGIWVYCLDVVGFGGVSLGQFIFLEKKHFVNREIKHEYGHTLQGYIFGPATLIIIGLPSVFWYWMSKIDSKYKKNYFNRYPEKWADRLGGVKRGFISFSRLA